MELGKKNEGKEYKKKSDNTMLKSYVKKITEEIVEKIEKNKIMHIKKKQNKNKKINQKQIKIQIHGRKDLLRILYFYDSEVYNKLGTVVTREIKRKYFMTPFDLLVISDFVFKDYSKNKNYKQSLDI